MKKKFLVTISDESEHLHGVRFLCSFFTKISENSVTLFHICRQNGTKVSLPNSCRNTDKASSGQPTVEASRAIDRARRLLAGQQMSAKQVIAKTVKERFGKAKDILTESSRGHYDAIILGRRASYTFQWMFERAADETIQQIVKDQSFVSPIWICPDTDPGRKNVLLCIDGSENCYRVADHVGYILSSQKQHSITLFHVENSVGTECVEFFQRAEKILLGHNINAKRIHRSLVWDLSVSGSILKEINKGNYAVAAVGMRGRNLSENRKSQFTGGVASKLINKIEKASLWCCP